MRWLVALVALLFPPALLVRRRGTGPLLVVLLWLAALAVFFLLAWGVGVLLMLLAGLLAALLALRK